MKQVLRLFILLGFIFSPFIMRAQVASFSVTPRSGCEPVAFTFSDGSTGAFVSHKFFIYWDSTYTSGSAVDTIAVLVATSTSSTYSTTFSKVGYYNVVDSAYTSTAHNVKTQHDYLFVHNDSTITTRVTTTNPGADTNSCPGHKITFVNKSDTIPGCTPYFTWTIADPSGAVTTYSTTGTAATLTHTFTATGAYTILLSETTCTYCTGSLQTPFTINIGSFPVACFSNNDSTPCSTPATISFTNCSSGASTYLWKFGDGGTDTASTPSHTYNKTGSIKDTLIAYSAFGCADTSIESGNIVIGHFIPGFKVSSVTICQYNSINTGTITFTDTTFGATSYSWHDNYSPAHTSTGSNPTFTYTTAGTYTITDSAYNATGCNGVVTHSVTVEATPVISFTANHLYRCTPNDTVTFTSTATDASGIASYKWHFGDTHNAADSSVLSNPSHTYTTSGSFTDSLFVTDDNGCSSLKINSAYVKVGAPTLSINPVSDSGCATFNFSFSTSLSPAVGYKIDSINYGDGSSTVISPASTSGSHSYTAGGVYTMTVSYHLPDTLGGCPYTATKSVTVGNTHATFATTVSADSVCPNTIFSVTSTCAGCTSFRWNFNSPSFPASSNEFSSDTTHEYTTQGKYYILAIADDAGCTDTVKDSIYVLPPAASMGYAFPNCSNPLIVDFTSTGSTGANAYHWSYGDGSTDTGASPQHTYTAYGTYTVTLIDSTISSTHQCFNRDSIVVHAYPLVDTFNASSTKVCAGKSIVFTGSLTGFGTIDSAYIWRWGDGTVPTVHYTSDTASHIYAHSGVYTDTLIIRSNGCYDTMSKSSYITVGGFLGGLTDTITEACAPISVTFKDNNTDYTGATITRHWDFNAPPSVTGTGVPATTFVHGSAADTSITYPPGAYTIVLVDSDNIGCTVSDTVHVKSQKANAYFYSVDSSIKACIGASIPFHDTNTHCTYAWSFGDGGTGTGQNPSHVYTANATYSISVVITTTAGGTLPVGCMDTFSRASYITVGNISIGFSLTDSTSSCPPIYEFATNTTSPLSEYSYSWRVTPFGTIVSTGTNLYHVLSSPGTNYSITLIANNSLGCMDSLTKHVVTTGPAGYVHYTTADSGCGSLTATICFVDTNGTTPSNYTWFTGDGSSYTNDSSCKTHAYLDSGVYHPYVLLQSGSCPPVQIPAGDAIAYTDSIQVYALPAIKVRDTMICYGLSDTLTATGADSGSTYTWSPAYGLSATTGVSVAASPTITTTYTITCTSIHGCSGSTTAKVTVDTMITINISGRDSICSGACDTLVASGGSNYTWSPASGLSATTGSSVRACGTTSTEYHATYTDLYGCKGADSFFVRINPLPSLITAIPSFTVCERYLTQLKDSATGGTWSSNDTLVATINSATGVVTGVTTGSTIITYTTGTGCTETHAIYVTRGPGPIQGNLNVCAGAQTILFDTVSGGTWSIVPTSGIANISGTGSSITVHGINAGSATVSYSISDGCAVSAEVLVHPKPDIILPDSPYICYGSTTTIAANSDAAKYLWTPNVLISSDTVYNPTFSDTVDQRYQLKETTSFGCQDSASILVIVYDSATVSVSNDTMICIGKTVQLNAFVSSGTISQDQITYLWSPSSGLNDTTISNPLATPGSTTIYTVAIRENPCFSTTRDVTITVIPIPEIALPASSTIVAGSSITLTSIISNGDSIASWLWTPSGTLSCDTCPNPIATPTTNTTYQVTVTTPIGCVGTNDVHVSIICVEASQIFVPNSFTPNGDGSNDRFYLSGRGLGLITRMSVYNRWGELVFDAKNINPNDAGAGWDGTYKGQVLQPDVFVYVFEMLCETGVPFKLTGDISIVR